MSAFTLVSLIAGIVLLVAYVCVCIANLNGYEDDGAAVVLAIFIGIASMCFFSSLYGRTMSFWQGASTLLVPWAVLIFTALACGGDTPEADKDTN